MCSLPLRFNVAGIHLVFQLHVSVTSATFRSSTTQQPREKPPADSIHPALKQKLPPPHFFTSLLHLVVPVLVKTECTLHFAQNPLRCHHSSKYLHFFLAYFFRQFFHSSAFSFQTKSLLLSPISFCFLRHFLNVLLSFFSS